MAILVDQARWPWRGTTWCHLVSDSHLDELHVFAGRLGCRRVGFQGDHYDIDIDLRDVAIEQGATACDSRELVRRLKAAGLRLKPSQFAKWQLRMRIDEAIDPATWQRLAGEHRHLARIESIAPDATFLSRSEGCFVLERGGAEAVVVYGSGEIGWAVEQPELGLFVRSDHRGRWALESFAPAPTAEQ